MTAVAVAPIAVSVYCHECGGDMERGTCTCNHVRCACGGCVTCNVHDRHRRCAKES